MAEDTVMAALCGVSAATLTTLMLRQGLRNVWLRGTRPLLPRQKRVAGRAFSLRFHSRARGPGDTRRLVGPDLDPDGGGSLLAVVGGSTWATHRTRAAP